MRKTISRVLRRTLCVALLLLVVAACSDAYRTETSTVTANDQADGAVATTQAPPPPAEIEAAAAPPPAPPDPAAAAPTPAPAPAPAAEATPAPAPAPVAPPPAAAPAPSGYALSHNPDGSVARWDPCRPITWRVNLTLAPLGALDDLTVAFDEVARATGMGFRYGGTTAVIPNGGWLDGGGEENLIVVAWAPTAASDLWTDAADGRGGWYAKGSSRDGTTWTWRIVRGFVLVDPVATESYAAGFGPGLTRGALLLHEVAHALGLSHVDDRAQLMYPTLGSATEARFSPGDLAGLARIGSAAGCIA